MMQQRARVTACLPNGRAQIAVIRESACSGDCHHCAGCGAVQQTVHAVAQNPIGAQCGEVVLIESAGGTVLLAAALIYLLPLGLFLGGYLTAMRFAWHPFLTGGACFALGLLPAILYNRHIKKNPPDYRIVKRLN